jgi:hypothetical protein
MSATKRPSTSSLRRYFTSRPYIAVTEIRRRFDLDPDAMSQVARNGTRAFIGLPEREALKVQDLWERGEIGLELSVEVRAPVVVGIYPMRIARYVIEGSSPNGQPHGNGHAHGTPPWQRPTSHAAPTGDRADADAPHDRPHS